VFASLIWPILISTVVLFVASLVSCIALGLHKKDWVKLAKEDELMAAVKKGDVPVGGYMFPGCEHMKDMASDAFQEKYNAGPRGLLTVLPVMNMGLVLGLMFVYFLVVSVGLAYLASVALPRGSTFAAVFPFVFVAGLMTFLAGIVAHSIWFRVRIVGHVIDSIGYAALTAAIFAAMWPAA
jgi:hypothetical protein